MILSAIYGYFARAQAELVSLYLSTISIIASFHISFTLGILINDNPGNVHLENKVSMTVFLVTIGIIIINCFILGYLYRNTLQVTLKLSDRMISLQESPIKLTIN